MNELLAGRAEAWAIDERFLKDLEAILQARARGTTWTPEAIQAAAAARRPAMQKTGGRVAIVPCFGVLLQRTSPLDEMLGFLGCETLVRTVESLVADSSVATICLIWDSPGGSVSGVQTAAQRLYELRGQKEIVSIASSTCASAALWLASQSTSLSVEPGGQIGSIGAYALHCDYSKALEMAGIRISLIAAGERKLDGNEYQPLSEEAQADILEKVTAYAKQFRADVARGRKVSVSKVESVSWGQGRMLLGPAAVKVGMADRCESIDQLLARLSGADSSAGMDGTFRGQLGASQRPLAARLAAIRSRSVEVQGDIDRGLDQDRREAQRALDQLAAEAAALEPPVTASEARRRAAEVADIEAGRTRSAAPPWRGAPDRQWDALCGRN